MDATTIGVDLAKSVVELALANAAWRVIGRKRLTRAQFERFLAAHPPTHLVMEACGTAHHWARRAKQGDVYLRMLLVHGARSVLCHAKRARQPNAWQHWALRTEQRRGHNIAAVALANKLARIVWAVWTEPRPFVAPQRESIDASSI